MKRSVQLVLLLAIAPFLLVACSDSTSTDDADGQEEASTTEEANENEDVEKYEELIAQFDPLGEVPIPEDNPMTEEKVELGKTLYFDPRLSGNDEISCATCHVPALGYSDGLPTFEGFEGAEGPRRTPTIINSAYYNSFFWDGRADSLEEQALGPISSPIEMNMNLDELADKLNGIEGYPEMFEEVFGEEITVENIAKAIAAFERTIVINDTRFDQFLAGDYDAMTEEEIFGMELFAGKAQCITCHNGPNLSDNNFYNVGLDSDDPGRMDITGNEADDGAFRTPGLYGIAHHAPYMHDGSLETLEEVIDFYDRGGDGHPNTSPKIQELNLTDEEKDALLAFLMVLSGDEVPQVEAPELPGM